MGNVQSTLLYKWFNEVWNNGNIDAINELMAENAIRYGIAEDTGQPGAEGFKEFYKGFKENFGKIHIDVEEVIKEGDMEVARCKVTALQLATGKQVEFWGLCMVRIENGKIVEAWNHFDFLTMYQQLGHKLVPPEG